MSAINSIVFNTTTITVNNRNRPYSNDFTVEHIQGPRRTRNGRPAVEVIVRTTASSPEPLRQYSCVYTLAGTLIRCQC